MTFIQVFFVYSEIYIYIYNNIILYLFNVNILKYCVLYENCLFVYLLKIKLHNKI